MRKLKISLRKDAEELLQLDEKVQAKEATKIKDEGLLSILPLYLKYRNIVRRLVICYDQMIQTQKRNLIKKMLDCAIGRMLEYKREIVNLDCSEHEWPDNFMIEMKLTPDDVVLTTPACFTSDRKALLEQRKKYIEDLIANANERDPSENENEVQSEMTSRMVSGVDLRPSKSRKRLRRSTQFSKSQLQPYTEPVEEITARLARQAQQKQFRDAILMIQKHERARTGRCVGIRAQRQYMYDQKLRMGEIDPKMESESRKMSAAITIQKAWRSYLARKSLKKKMNRVEELLGMTIPSWKPHEIFDRDEENFQRRLALQPLAVKKIQERTNNERAKLWKIRGPGLMEDITDEIREWFILWYNELGYFDVYPAAEAGGSVLVTTGQTLTPEEYLLDKWEKKKAAQKGKDKEKQDLTEKKKAAKALAKELAAKEKEKGWRMPESKTLPYLKDAIDYFIKNWTLRDESGNPHQREYVDLITDGLCYELQLEMREIVDELMRLELDKLNQALKKDHKGDKEKFDTPKTKKAKKSKKKGKKDPLSDVAVEDLFKELVLAKILKQSPEANLRDWIGDLSYQNYEAQQEFREYNYRLGEIKQLVMEYCILPLGSKEVHQLSPLVKSVCICGLPQYGKSYLANSICSELGALLFDLTPSVLVGQYDGKKSEQRLMDIIGKVSRSYPPSVIFIDGGEKPWWKKIPPEEKYTEPKRFSKLLPKFVKGIKPGDQILFLTLSTEPYNAGKTFVKIHDKFIIIPVTDYNSLYLFYTSLLMKYHGIDRNLDVSCLAKVSVGLPLEFIRESVEKSLHLKRRIQLKFKPLNQQEIMEELLKYNGPGSKVIEKFKKFESKTPLGRKKVKMIAAEREKRLKVQKKKK
ncbi:dynein regulatory complex protein 11-like isoform X2 [Belonocnema kinseyi]|uniref:dynein regulatory complex protein 11-like isoform X2 n=1 Tax=Belonocnema kinseyi TaxID=2817044 RepID=UPI00143D18A9|nr:dynein regulatory complex protein 11-like isoform X2 [Belonocnema kinseyi]